jgi:hypothetical protein
MGGAGGDVGRRQSGGLKPVREGGREAFREVMIKACGQGRKPQGITEFFQRLLLGGGVEMKEVKGRGCGMDVDNILLPGWDVPVN